MDALSNCCLLLSLLIAADQPRNEISLNGPWQVQRVSELQSPPTGGAWAECTVPGYLSGTNYQRAWFRRSFEVPTTFRGKRLKLHFGGVKYNSQVFVNGKNVGGCFGGYEAFTLDVTDAVRFDGPNDLVVGCHDWTGVFTSEKEKVAFPDRSDADSVRSVPADRILSPVGGIFGSYGIWDNVTLEALSAVYIKDVFVKPSVRKKELLVEYTLVNESGSEVEAKLGAIVEDAGAESLRLDPVAVLIPAGQSAKVALCKAWSNPPLWSQVDPHLLWLQSSLEGGDQLRTRFGFREFWVEGDKFFLNGSRINLLATSWWPPQGVMDREAIRKAWLNVKKIGCVAFRTHTQPWPSLHYDVADEVGLLMIIEGAVWNDDDTYRIYDSRFWENYASHLKSMVEQHRNRPSVVMWSLENEFLGGRLNDKSTAKKDLVRMGQLVRQWDPTRPLFYESDGDPDGVADCIGIHYPHEYPDFTCWPNETRWLEKPASIPHMFLNGAEKFEWRRDKPLYIGEFLWIPSRDPSWHTVFFGDEAYRDYNTYRNRAKAESWKMQILGYRDLEVGGMSPWTVVEGGPMDETNPLFAAHQSAYQHIAAFALDYDTRFYSRERVTRRLAVFNDILDASSLTLRWQLTQGTSTVASGQTELSLSAGERKHLHIVLPMPDVSERQLLDWHWQLERNGRQAFQDNRGLSVFPVPELPSLSARIGLYDPLGTTKELLGRMRLKTEPVESLERLPANIDVLIIGSCSLKASVAGVPVVGQVYSPRQSLVDFTASGGRLLVLRQETYPESLFDVSLTGQRSTMTFSQAKHHPALDGIDADDLKFWRGDNMVALAEAARPVAGTLPIVVSGSAAGIDTSPLLARPMGRGCMVFCQMLLTEKYFEEPAAARVFGNLLKWLDGYRAETGRTVVIGPTEYKALLSSWGVRCDGLKDAGANSAEAALSGTRPRLVICRNELPDLQNAREFVETGGRLWLHRLTPDKFAAAAAALGVPLEVRPYKGPVSRAEGDSPFFDFVSREDLYWLGPHRGIDWAETPRAASMAEGVFAKSLAGKSVTAYEIDQWTLEGGIVERRKPGVVFATVGSARKQVEFPVSGDYLIGVHARGTPSDGILPLVRVAVDGKPVGTLSTGPEWQTTTVTARIEKGSHELSIAFINDGSHPPLEDRNLFADQVLVALDDGGDGTTVLTTPAALAISRLGQGAVVWDQIAWDTEEANSRKASRLAGSLMTALGAESDSQLGVIIEAEHMTPQPGVPHFSNTGTFASMACSGYISSPLRAAQSGRYRIDVVATGSSAAGVYPEVDVLVDGRSVGTIHLVASNWRTYSLPMNLQAGDHELRLAFTNDFSGGGEDRNLSLDRATIYRDE